MAIYPKKIQDSTESALSAVEDALNPVSSSSTSGNGHPATSPEVSVPSDAPYRASRNGTSAVDHDLFENASAADDQPARRAANDDRQSIGQILQTLQRTPPKTSYLVAALFALAWVIGGGILAAVYMPDL